MAENHTIEKMRGILRDVSIKTSSKGNKYLSLVLEDENGDTQYINSFSKEDLELEYKLHTDRLYEVEYYTDKGGYKKLMNITLIEGQTELTDFTNKQKEKKNEPKKPDLKEKQIIRMSALKASLDYYKILALIGDKTLNEEVLKPLSPRNIEETAIEFERFIMEVFE